MTYEVSILKFEFKVKIHYIRYVDFVKCQANAHWFRDLIRGKGCGEKCSSTPSMRVC